MKGNCVIVQYEVAKFMCQSKSSACITGSSGEIYILSSHNSQWIKFCICLYIVQHVRFFYRKCEIRNKLRENHLDNRNDIDFFQFSGHAACFTPRICQV